MADQLIQKPEKKWIVICDDDESNLHLTAWIFIDQGESVAGFTTGAALLDFLKLRAGKIKAVLLDLSLPVLDGLTIAEQIRINEQAYNSEPVPLAFYTAHHQSAGGATERVAAKTQVEKIFHKPDDTPELYDKVSAWLESREKQSEELQNAKTNYSGEKKDAF
jgi:CheY-like chemotaxis protein